ncbi:putative UvrD/REP helicase [Treponema primitia ZAS-2]|uniref:DNA 3'-5' helicase n=1 Tax=Treponema primitia (strain ATCC BAA-887 / DSM 12427 / ZAS-2) TaxID=545694 RepID=F5YLX7_TREPZ|nr:UvrD-helicase domain-containing protein [Treponema primitia]AEF83964.1 putative UvrD/REP helicase [Treponema primitia ZAS-2]
MSTINIINASAGSGKTYWLTKLAGENVVNGISANRLFATTFTKKAAAELVERLRQRLLSDGKEEEVNLLSDGFVGTVNSVCARLLTEYAIDAGLSPALDVIPEEDTGKIFNMAVEEAIAEQADKLEPVARRLSRYGAYRQGDWRNDVKDIAKMARDNRLDSGAIEQSAKKSWESFSTLLPNTIQCDTAALVQAIQSAIDALSKLAKLSKGSQVALEALEEIKKTASDPERLPWSTWAKLAKLSTPKDGKDAVAEVQGLAGEWLKNRRFHEDVKTMIDGAFYCAALAVEHFQTYKKQHGLMDFTDQESGVLDLFEGTESQFFQDSLKNRLSLLLVDEFQDTSPIQLAIFLELNQLCGSSFWVGDPKQSIYGFRGSDPVLMNVAADHFSKIADPRLNKPLSDSWRSQKLLVDFSNAVFKNVFHEMPENKVTLNIPSQREKDAKGGNIEAWLLDAQNKSDTAIRLAIAIQTLLGDTGAKPGDIAVLCRKNDDCDDLANALESIGLRASTARGSLVKTPACRLVLAALRYLADKKDTLAMIEVINFLGNHGEYKDWLAKLVNDRDAYLDELKSNPVFQNLDARRDELRRLTPLEALEYAIDASGVLEAAASWPNTPLALANLDKLRLSCVKYLDLCRARHDSGSLSGYLSYLTENDIKESEGSDDQAIQVLTYHKAKGLEWKVVILFNLDDGLKGSAFNLSAKTEGAFDPQNPLNNRILHFWPDPLPGNQTSDELESLLLDCPEQQEAIDREIKERQRLLYVGFTRARDSLILAVHRKTTNAGAKLMTAWLDELTDADHEPLITLPVSATGKHLLNIGGTQIPITIKEYTEKTQALQLTRPELSKRRPLVPADLPLYPPARYSPSALEWEAEALSKITVSERYSLGNRIAVKGTPDYNLFGTAVHNFLAVEQGKRNAAEWENTAHRLLERYGILSVIHPADMVEIHKRVTQFITNTYPGAKIRREWPISLRERDNRLMQGFIDMLLELDNGFVILDHKTFPGANAEEKAREYAPQLAAYRRAVEAAAMETGTGKKVLAALIHMPVIGKIYEVENTR